MKKILIVGAGIVGLSIARNLCNKGFKKVIILEKEKEIASHQSSRNSGVMHAGLYYKPGSLKAELSRKGIKLMKKYCTDNKIEWEECGQVVVANDNQEIKRLDQLFYRGLKNNLIGIKRLKKDEVNKYEPYVNAKEAIFIPEESIVNYKNVANSYLNEILALGGQIIFDAKISKMTSKNEEKILTLNNGEIISTDIIIVCAGLYTDKVSESVGIDIEKQRVIPFRGEYYLLKKEYRHLVKGLIYPVPNPNFPFLGSHFTKMINGNVEAGPNAVLALAREGYEWGILNFEECLESLTYEGLRKFIFKYPFTSFEEITRSLIKPLFVKNLQRLIPEIRSDMLTKGESGVRAQLMNRNGNLIQDFDIRVQDSLISILNAPSPAATSSIAIADYVINRIELNL